MLFVLICLLVPFGSVPFCFVPFCYLYRFVLYHFVTCTILLLVPFCSVPFCSVPFCSVPFCSVPFCGVPFCKCSYCTVMLSWNQNFVSGLIFYGSGFRYDLRKESGSQNQIRILRKNNNLLKLKHVNQVNQVN